MKLKSYADYLLEVVDCEKHEGIKESERDFSCKKTCKRCSYFEKLVPFEKWQRGEIRLRTWEEYLNEVVGCRRDSNGNRGCDYPTLVAGYSNCTNACIKKDREIPFDEWRIVRVN